MTDLAWEAALNRDFGLCLDALMRDPLVSGRITRGEAMLRAMLENTRKYLTGWKI